MATVSQSCRSWDVCQKWAAAIHQEFFAQGDEEKALGVPVQVLNDRDKVSLPNSQIGFIEFMNAPMVLLLVDFFPVLKFYAKNCADNINEWWLLWADEPEHSPELLDKTAGRVQKLIERCNQSMDSATAASSSRMTSHLERRMSISGRRASTRASTKTASGGSAAGSFRGSIRG